MRAGQLSLAACGLCAACCAAAALAVHRVSRDPNAAADSYMLLEEERVQEILAEQRSAFADYVHRVEIGSRLGSFHVFGESEVFRPGMHANVLVRFTPQHPFLRLDLLLIGPDGRELHRTKDRVAASLSHWTIALRLTEQLPPGRYRVIVQFDGYEVARKSFDLARD